ncbi:MAG TPA: ABC transporter permease [Hanamia sp.]|nr:ABC transporter permease [Hanamia sp.]
MFSKNFTIAFRSLKKDLLFTLTNIVGLTIGITCCLLILSFVKYELSFDKYNKNYNRIYRVNYDARVGGSESLSPSVPVFVAPVLKDKFPEIGTVTRFEPSWGSQTIRHDNVIFDEDGFCFADSAFFDVFNFKAVEGNLKKALNKPHSLVITSDMAKKYFGDSDPIGQTLLLNNKQEYVVSAVMENVPPNSHFKFDFLTSFYSIDGFDSSETKVDWNNPNYSTYLLLKPGTKVASLSNIIDQWVNPPEKAKNSSAQNSIHLQLEPLKEVHFDTHVFNYKNYFKITDYKYVRIFITIAILVLLIACANYINLSTAKSSVRAKEVGIRKTIGASLWQLFAQFLTESFLLTFFAVAISIFLVNELLPYLNNLLGKEIPFYLLNRNMLIYIITGGVLVSILAGFYPAIILSRFRPTETLKGNYSKAGGTGAMIRKSLVIFQFAISIALILGTIIVRSQLGFMQSAKLGLDKDHILIIHGNQDLKKNFDAFASEIKNVNGVQDVSKTWRSPFQTVIGNGFSIKAHPTADEDISVVGGIAGDQHYLSTLGISLIAGRNFDPAKIKGDSTTNEFIVNQAFLARYDLQAKDAIGKQVFLGIAGEGTIVGVVKDFHTSSMHDLIQPVVICNSPQWFGNILVRIGPGKIAPVLAGLEKTWKSFVPMQPFNYSFLDEEYDALYRTEQRLGTLMSWFCGTAILITCLGLLGLMAFMVTQRTKEIGIRKVLGASVLNITGLLSKDFLKLVIIAILIALPAAWYFMNGWLRDFAYRINMSWWLFALTAVIAMLIALITISYQSIKAALANPVKSLRTE